MSKPTASPTTGAARARALADSIATGTATVGVIGLGYVGLPLVREIAHGGLRVMGFDIDPAKIERLLRGESYIGHLSDALVAQLLTAGRFVPTADFDRLAEPDAILICVPTPLDRHHEPDLSYIVKTAESIARRLRPGQLVVLESTTYPGTTEEVVRPILDATGLVLEEDYFLAFSPEREDPGNPHFTTRKIPKVVGGAGPRSSELARALYGRIVERVVPVRGTREAEAAKLLENIYRCVNIALVNELKMLFDRMGIDIWEVIEASKTKPFGFHAFYPGPGLGGHCIPVDPYYLTWKAREYDIQTRFISLAGEINTGMPDYVVARLMDALNDSGRALKGARVLVLGVAYKKNIDDIRESPALKLIELLHAKGAVVAYHDPHIPRFAGLRAYDLAMESVPLTASLLAAQDAALIVADHDRVDYRFVLAHAPLVVDTRNATRGLEGAARVVRA